MTARRRGVPFAASFMFLSLIVMGGNELYAQQVHSGHAPHDTQMLNIVFGLLELPFLLTCIYFAFHTASALKGGIFGRGMALLAWGFLVMALGHAHMQLEHFTGYNLFNDIFGPSVGPLIWIVALVLTWGLSGAGFYKIYSVSKGTVGV